MTVLRILHGQSAVVPLGLPEVKPGLPAESRLGVVVVDALPKFGGEWEGLSSAQINRGSPSL